MPIGQDQEISVKAYDLIKKLAAIFEEHGKPLSRREYKRLKVSPSFSTIQRHIGWGVAKNQASLLMKAQGLEKTGCGFHPSSLITPEDDERLAIMAGLKKVGLPPKFRKTLANLVMETERSFLKLPRYKLPEINTDLETAILLLSDLHTGTSVFDEKGQCLYNQDIMTFRTMLIKEQACRIIDERLTMGRIDEFVIAMVGDIVDGSGIYPGQELNQDLTAFVPQISLAVACVWDIVIEVQKHKVHGKKIPVKIKGVRGNHGRQYKYANAANNFDYVVLQMLYMLAYSYDPENISVEYSNASYMNFQVKGFTCHMRHEAPVQTETAAARSKFMGWQAIHDYDLIFYGHKHHPGNGSVLDCDAFMNGSLVGINDLAEHMATFSRPSQTLIGIDPAYGRTYAYNLYADRFAKGGEAALLLNRYPNLKTPF